MEDERCNTVRKKSLMTGKAITGKGYSQSVTGNFKKCLENQDHEIAAASGMEEEVLSKKNKRCGNQAAADQNRRLWFTTATFSELKATPVQKADHKPGGAENENQDSKKRGGPIVMELKVPD